MTIILSIEDELYNKIIEKYPDNINNKSDIHRLLQGVYDGLEVKYDMKGHYIPTITE